MVPPEEDLSSVTDLENTDINTAIEGLLKEICSDPGISSNPQDHIAAHPQQYKELCNYGEDTIRYCLNRFEQGNETDLEGRKRPVLTLQIIFDLSRLTINLCFDTVAAQQITASIICHAAA